MGGELDFFVSLVGLVLYYSALDEVPCQSILVVFLCQNYSEVVPVDMSNNKFSTEFNAMN